MNTMKPATAFRRAMKVIEHPTRYTQVATYAIDAAGYHVTAEKRGIIAWSFFGAIDKATGYWNNSQCYEAILAVAAADGVREVGQLGAWSRSLSHEQALAALALAADVADRVEVRFAKKAA